MSKFNPFARHKDPPTPPAPDEEEQRRQRQQNARQFFEAVRQEPHSAPPPSDLPLALGREILVPPPTPQLPAALDVAQELERARANGLFGGTVRQIRKEAEAEEQVGRAVQSKLQTRTDIVARSETLLKAQNSLKSTLYDGQIQEEEQAAKLSRARLARLQAERDLLTKMSAPPAPASAPVAPPPLPAVRITDAQVEEEAVKLVVRLGGGGDEPMEACRQELAAQYPPLVVEEIVRRAYAIRQHRNT